MNVDSKTTMRSRIKSPDIDSVQNNMKTEQSDEQLGYPDNSRNVHRNIVRKSYDKTPINEIRVLNQKSRKASR